MADFDKTLEILIKLGYVGAENAEKARAALSGIKEETGDLADSMNPAWANAGKLGDELKTTGERAEGFTAKGFEMRRMLMELERIQPGLAEGFRALVMGGGPIAVLILGLQAATAWWQYFHHEAEVAAKAQADALDKVREATRAAVEENSKFAESLAETRSNAQAVTDALEEQTAVQAGLTKAQHELLAAEEKAEKASAKSPEEKAGITLKYEKKRQKLEDDARNQKLADEKKAIDNLQGQQDKLEFERGQNADQYAAAAATGYLPEMDRLQAIIDAQDKQTSELKTAREPLERKYATNVAVANAEQSERRPTRAAEVVSEFGGAESLVGAVATNAEILKHGGRLTDAQVATNQAFTELMQLMGANGSQILQLVMALAENQRNQKAEINAIKASLPDVAY